MEKEKKSDAKAPKVKKLTAKKSHRIVQNQIDIKIKAGAEIVFGSGPDQIPERFRETLKTEGVI